LLSILLLLFVFCSLSAKHLRFINGVDASLSFSVVVEGSFSLKLLQKEEEDEERLAGDGLADPAAVSFSLFSWPTPLPAQQFKNLGLNAILALLLLELLFKRGVFDVLCEEEFELLLVLLLLLKPFRVV
jgi:hypothetical protein